MAAVVRGRALIFWDLKVLGRKKKLDAIDTDQITPATDCVSESLETLDERWKAGSFRYLMPDFRARVHRGETFLVAGDRFAIGSSREMRRVRRGAARARAIGAGRARRREAGRRTGAANDVDRAERLGAPCRQARRREAGRDAARVRGSAPGVGRHGAVRHSHVQPD